jgi:hypothetical protein
MSNHKHVVKETLAGVHVSQFGIIKADLFIPNGSVTKVNKTGIDGLRKIMLESEEVVKCCASHIEGLIESGKDAVFWNRGTLFDVPKEWLTTQLKKVQNEN